jgi:hypothetical protein
MVIEMRFCVQFLRSHIFSDVHNNFHLSYCLLSMHMTQARDRDSHVLDYRIRGSLTTFISAGFYDWTDRGWSSSMLCSIPPVTYFLLLRRGDLEFELRPRIFCYA